MYPSDTVIELSPVMDPLVARSNFTPVEEKESPEKVKEPEDPVCELDPEIAVPDFSAKDTVEEVLNRSPSSPIKSTWTLNVALEATE